MVPIKAKSLIKKVSQSTGIPEPTVERVVDFYYQSLKNKLTTLDFTSFVLEQFGKFYIKERCLVQDEDKARYLVQKAKDMGEQVTPKVESMGRVAQENLYKYEEIKKMLSQTKQKKEFISLHKKTYKDDQIREALEGQVENSKGTS